MEGFFPALLQNNLSFALTTGFITLLGFSVKILKGAFDFHYEYFTRRQLRRMTDLLPQVDQNSQLYHFLKQAISIEVFKIASVVKTTNINAAALMHLCRFKRISPSQVKNVVRHIKVRPDGRVTISIWAMERIAAYYSLTASVVIFVFGLYALVTSFAIDAKYGWAAGVIVFLICLMPVRFFLKDWRNYQQIKRIQSELLANPIPICEECRAASSQSIIQAEPADNSETSSVKSPDHVGGDATSSPAQTSLPAAANAVVAGSSPA